MGFDLLSQSLSRGSVITMVITAQIHVFIEEYAQ